MKMKHTLYYITSFCMVMLWSVASFSQNNTKPADTLIFKQSYGLRIGGDIGKLARSFIDDDYKGFEINGDYRLTKRLYVAGEIGTEEKTTSTNYLNTTAKGSYLKAGVDYNLYTNWLDMENMIYGGFRASFGTFSQTLNSYTVYNTDQYWEEQFSVTEGQEFKGLSALWVELVIGIKAEVFNNLYLSFNMQLKSYISQDEPENFGNLYIPGFNKVYDSGRFGVGFGYNLSYLIPIYKKDKKEVIQN
ncbi:hypothetical protein OE09_1380 [Flavobacteriaceae bacterium MAR_2010_72]|nr:hypothetical protein OE09_1380 [Flavobacteriaceae bacterium MAR_2010_72]